MWCPMGGGVMAFAKLCASLDVLGLDRKVIGFDTFEGFPHLSEIDKQSKEHNEMAIGAYNSFSEIEQELQECIQEFDADRLANHYNKIELIKGDACQTIPKYIQKNPQTMVSLLYLDFDLYEPTKIALEFFVPRMIRGGIIAFDELNEENWKGETCAAFDFFGDFNKCRLQKFDFTPRISYMIIE